MAGARHIRGGLGNRYISSNAGFYDRIAFERLNKDPYRHRGPESARPKAVPMRTVEAGSRRKVECPICQKKFATEQSMLQHRRDSQRCHASGPPN